ncbi:MAG: hypothetical protein ACRD2U_05290 [Terriglobales bacterium]
MEDIAHMVSASLARHGFVTQVDHRRLQWSQWSRCESSFSVLLAPSKPGLFALAEQQAAVGDKRILALFQISETEDLGMALARLFLPNSSGRDRLLTRPCFVRYAVIEDADQRRASYCSLQEVKEIPDNLTVHNFAESEDDALPATGT